MKANYYRIKIDEEFGLLFIGLCKPGTNLNSVLMCNPAGETVFKIPRIAVTPLTQEQFAKCLQEEAKYQRDQRATPLN